MKSFWSYFVMGAFLILVMGVGISMASDEKSENAPGTSNEEVAAQIEGSVDIEALAIELKNREAKLLEQANLLRDWEDRLKVQETRIKSRIEELKLLTDRKTKVSEDLQKRQEVVEANLVKTYETMNPRKAAEILSVMEQPLAVELLMAMKAKKVASILDKMDSNKAMILSSEIAERKPAEAK